MLINDSDITICEEYKKKDCKSCPLVMNRVPFKCRENSHWDADTKTWEYDDRLSSHGAPEE